MLISAGLPRPPGPSAGCVSANIPQLLGAGLFAEPAPVLLAIVLRSHFTETSRPLQPGPVESTSKSPSFPLSLCLFLIPFPCNHLF